MGLEIRNGRPYFYEKVRDGDRVCSLYLGSGDVAIGYAIMAEEDRLEAEEERAELEAEEAAWMAEDAAEESLVDAATDAAERAVGEALVAAGYHRPSRKWEWIRCRKT